MYLLTIIVTATHSPCNVRIVQLQCGFTNFVDNCIFVPVDVTKPEDVESALQRTKGKFGRLDAAVNCAGIGVAFKTYNFNKKKPHQLDDFLKVRLLLLRRFNALLTSYMSSTYCNMSLLMFRFKW